MKKVKFEGKLNLNKEKIAKLNESKMKEGAQGTQDTTCCDTRCCLSAYMTVCSSLPCC